MSRPESIHLRRSDADTLSSLVATAGGGRDAECVALLDEELARATVVADDALPPHTVALDTSVCFFDEERGEEREITLVVPTRAAPDRGRISVLSPVGCALIGLAEGDVIDWPLPNGRMRRLRVLTVS